MQSLPRTDLALEAAAAFEKANPTLPGVSVRTVPHPGGTRQWVAITHAESGKKLGKAPGNYITLEPKAEFRGDTMEESAQLLAESLSLLLPPLPEKQPVLVVGLGNEAITPDALGPLTVRKLFVTRHLQQQFPDIFGQLRPVAALETGVLATTGMETVETLSALVAQLHPALVIAVDALACLEASRLCRTVQITDTGISPGAGVGNRQAALDHKTLGVPVIALGVPTVISAKNLVGGENWDADGLIVTPRDIDQRLAAFSRLLGYGISLALQPELDFSALRELMEQP